MSGQPNVINDIGTLLKIPGKVTTELVQKANLCIGSIISDAKLAGDQTVIINIGIGTLSVDLIDMQCKFVPSKDLKTAIKTSLSEEKDILELALEEALVEKLLTACDEAL
jgi:MoaA/NifB/PqqE/SkfB family radical SAM enzyme